MIRARRRRLRKRLSTTRSAVAFATLSQTQSLGRWTEDGESDSSEKMLSCSNLERSDEAPMEVEV